MHILVVDPIYFNGGSKRSVKNILRSYSGASHKVSVLTVDPSSWCDINARTSIIYEPKFLCQYESGFLYFFRHFVVFLNIIMFGLTNKKADIVVGASGPGVDLSIYLAKFFMRYIIVQTIHGPLSNSRTILRCLFSADHIFYLDSVKQDLYNFISKVDCSVKKGLLKRRLDQNSISFVNGIPSYDWPTPCQYRKIKILWAASLLHWKGLDIFLNALALFDLDDKPEASICYIEPKNTDLPVTKINHSCALAEFYKEPSSFDQIRASCNIFVSTSLNEPFGLSILEALAAGLCVFIPNDGAFWDRHLQDNINCIKYTQGSDSDLFVKLSHLCMDSDRLIRIANNGKLVAEGFRADSVYYSIHSVFNLYR